MSFEKNALIFFYLFLKKIIFKVPTVLIVVKGGQDTLKTIANSISRFVPILLICVCVNFEQETDT